MFAKWGQHCYIVFCELVEQIAQNDYLMMNISELKQEQRAQIN